MVLSGVRLPLRFGAAAERVIGVLVYRDRDFGDAWRAKKLHAHVHTHEGSTHWHVHSHASSPSHDHGHRALFGIGMLHGLAGTGVLVAALPLAIEGSKASGLLYLAAFGVGTICSMALFAGAAGHLLTVTSAGRASFQRNALGLAGIASAVVGIWWLASGGN